MRDSGGAHSLFAIGSMALGVFACRAQVTANVNASEVEDDRKWEIAEPTSASPEAPSSQATRPAPRVASAVAAVSTPVGGIRFLGVAHDLSLSSGAPRAAVCRCLAVAHGAPSDPQFTWQAETPAGDANVIAIAIASDGVACPSGAPPQHASISAVEHEGTDIVVVVENVGEGRPIMHGALVAWPGPNGAIVVRTRHGTPYPAASSPAPCRIALK